jgi:Xaa-Pro dipeptidase
MNMNIYEKRCGQIQEWMIREGIALIMLEDFESRRNPAVRWLSGQPGDALFFLSPGKPSLLVPWDVNMAAAYARAGAVVPFGDFERSPIKALRGAAEYLNTPKGSRLEIPSVTSYPRFLQFVEEIHDFDIICRDDGVGPELDKGRAVKDEDEIKIYRIVSAITCEITDAVEKLVGAGKLKTEADVALFIEAEGRRRGCEGTGFETLAAGPRRSFGIHAFPAYTGGAFASPGLSILDFGLKYAGYTSDVTLTFAREPLSKAQEKMLALTEKAHGLAAALIKQGAAARDIAAAVDTCFARAKKTMPHALGHGIGLEAHEAPSFRNRADNGWILESGMVITLEPGLYDPAQGGCRLENDFLVTETGAEMLTNSRIIRL